MPLNLSRKGLRKRNGPRRQQCHTDAMALQGTKGIVALRYCAVVILMAVTQLAGFWFH